MGGDISVASIDNITTILRRLVGSLDEESIATREWKSCHTDRIGTKKGKKK